MRQGEAFITTRSERETAYIGMLLGRIMDRPWVVALKGGLGAGKTVFIRGAACGLGVKEKLTSPTFVLLNCYQGRLPVYHFDFYRLQGMEELDCLGFEEYLPGDGIAFVEWADRFPWLLPCELLSVTIERIDDAKGEGRRLWMDAHEETGARLVEMVMEGITWQVNGDLKMLPFFAKEAP